VTIPRAGFFIVQNKCVVGSHAVILASSAPGKVIGVPPGESIQVFCDGVDMDFVALGRINEYEDWAVSTVPRWVLVCTVPPYLNCDGSAFSGTTYSNTAAYLGGTTLPDLRGRSRAALNQTTGRITTAGSGIDGDTILSAGGEQTHTLVTAELAVHSHAVTDPGHTHTVPNSGSITVQGGTGAQPGGAAPSNTGSNTTGITIASSGSGTPHNNMQPTTIAGLTLIRAG
jgi:microcystin-dependent protein